MQISVRKFNFALKKIIFLFLNTAFLKIQWQKQINLKFFVTSPLNVQWPEFSLLYLYSSFFFSCLLSQTMKETYDVINFEHVNADWVTKCIHMRIFY